MDSTQLGAVVALGGMLLVCAAAVVDDLLHPAGGAR